MPAPCQVALFSEETVKSPSKYKPPAPWLILLVKVTSPFAWSINEIFLPLFSLGL